MKEILKDLLKDHVENNKLDTFATLFLEMYITSCILKITNEVKEVLEEIGVKKCV